MTKDHSRRRFLHLAGLTVGGLAVGGAATAAAQSNGTGQRRGHPRYRVTVSNLTRGQPFTPPLLAVHDARTGVFSVGEPAGAALAQLAENGALAPLTDALDADDDVAASVVAGDGPLVPASDPGDTGFPHSVTVELVGHPRARSLSFASMLVATNDGFTGLDAVDLPSRVGESESYFAASYDAGTEQNTEDFADMVPPAQALLGVSSPKSGTGTSDPDIAEDDVVRPHPGIVGDADLDPAVYGWRDPAALVHVERIA